MRLSPLRLLRRRLYHRHLTRHVFGPKPPLTLRRRYGRFMRRFNKWDYCGCGRPATTESLGGQGLTRLCGRCANILSRSNIDPSSGPSSSGPSS